MRLQTRVTASCGPGAICILLRTLCQSHGGLGCLVDDAEKAVDNCPKACGKPAGLHVQAKQPPCPKASAPLLYLAEAANFVVSALGAQKILSQLYTEQPGGDLLLVKAAWLEAAPSLMQPRLGLQQCGAGAFQVVHTMMLEAHIIGSDKNGFVQFRPADATRHWDPSFHSMVRHFFKLGRCTLLLIPVQSHQSSNS